MPVAPSSQSGCQSQVPVLGSPGPSNHPLGVRRSSLPSPLTSPEPTPWPAAAVPKSCFFQVGSGDLEVKEYQTTTLVELGRMSGWPSASRSTSTAASLVPGLSISW